MLRFLLLRPIAVIMLLIAALAVSIISFFQLPVSLLPDIDVPEITISVQHPNSSPEEIEENVLKPIRESMLTMNGVKALESQAHQERGIVSIRMQYGVDMDLAYIEANEKIDRLSSMLPPDLSRPLVIKSNTSDIPIVRIQIIPNQEEDQLMVSELAKNALKRRIEQVEGVGLVDINGSVGEVIRVTPDYDAMSALQINDDHIIKTIRDANIELGALSVKDGNYRYFLKLTSRIEDPAELSKLPISRPGPVIRLSQVAQIQLEPETPAGFHLFNGQRGLVIAVHKQADARMPDVMPQIKSIVDQFQSEYAMVHFEITQDQSSLLTLSIENLTQALIWGALFAFIVLFIFMGGWREPLVMGIVIPVSLLLCFSLLDLFQISLNIISLSGLALGLGMLVDNSIVVIDNIVCKRTQSLSILESCVHGTQEVMTPLISSAVTNLAVFVPLIFMSGITGALFYDQAIAVTCILFVSLLCTFIFVPLMYMLLHKRGSHTERQDSRVFTWIKSKYEQSFQKVWKRKWLTVSIMITLIPVSVVLFLALPKHGFPAIERNESIAYIDWNEPITLEESLSRTRSITNNNGLIKKWEADIGHQQFILNPTSHTAQEVELFMQFEHHRNRLEGINQLQRSVKERFPSARVEIKNAPNAFEQLFISKRPYYEVRIRDANSKQLIDIETANAIVSQNRFALLGGNGFETEAMAFITLDYEKMRLYGISYPAIAQKLKIVFGDFRITDFKNFGDVTPVVISQSKHRADTQLTSATVLSENGGLYPLQQFISVQYQLSYKSIPADAAGTFQSLTKEDVEDETGLRKEITAFIQRYNLTANFAGTWFDDRENLRQVTFILLLSFILMYFIITAEFESFSQPAIVMLTIPIGLSGSLMLLWLTGGSLNMMSGIGLVVVLGILDNDAILKIDRVNALRKSLPLEVAVRQAGVDRFKPIIMNTCTNALALLPIILSTGLGADLQRPVAIAIIGGLIISTITALYFIPIVYWLITKKKYKTSISVLG